MRQNTKNVSPMSNEGRNTYVIEHITDAMLTLLVEKPVEDISISELCDYAKVGRASFYRNYESKEDIVKVYLNQLIAEWIEEYGKKENVPLSEQIRGIFAHFEKYMDFYKLMYNRNLVYLLKDVFIGIYGPKTEDDGMTAYAKAFVAYSTYGWIEVWFQRGMRETSEEMAMLFKSQGL